MANAAARNKAQQKVSGGKDKVAGAIAGGKIVETQSRADAKAAIKKAQKASATTPAGEKAPKAPKGPSIRSTIIELLQAGKTTAEITPIIQQKFPNSKAAEKAATHIAFYRSKLKTGALGNGKAPAAE